MGSRGGDIGENTTGATEDIVLYLNTFVNGNIVLDADTIAYADIVAYVHILAKGAIAPNMSTFLNMAEVPYLGSFTYDDIFVNVTAFVYKVFIHDALYYLYIFGGSLPNRAHRFQRWF